MHQGAYVDPTHYTGADSWAGMRFIAEDPSHTLIMVGTDDGAVWWRINGTCAGPAMSDLTFDFSAKGGPSHLKGTAVDNNDGTSEIDWEDGNVWTYKPTPSGLSGNGGARHSRTRHQEQLMPHTV